MTPPIGPDEGDGDPGDPDDPIPPAQAETNNAAASDVDRMSVFICGLTVEQWNGKSRSFASLRMTTREAQDDNQKGAPSSIWCAFSVPPFYRSTQDDNKGSSG
jgi:hypothetical protein